METESQRNRVADKQTDREKEAEDKARIITQKDYFSEERRHDGLVTKEPRDCFLFIGRSGQYLSDKSFVFDVSVQIFFCSCEF